MNSRKAAGRAVRDQMRAVTIARRQLRVQRIGYEHYTTLREMMGSFDALEMDARRVLNHEDIKHDVMARGQRLVAAFDSLREPLLIEDGNRLVDIRRGVAGYDHRSFTALAHLIVELRAMLSCIALPSLLDVIANTVAQADKEDDRARPQG